MRRMVLMVLGAFALLAVPVVPAFAVTDGELDGNVHPAVLLLLMEVNGAPAFRCSGTLLAPQVFLTAGHCAGEPNEFSGMRVFTDSDVQAGIGTTNNYPFGGLNSVEAVAWAAHPLFTEAQFSLHDVGVVMLAAPGVVLADPADYGVLPAVNQLDSLKTKRGHQDLTFTAVGYGLQKSYPTQASFLASNTRTRYEATPHLIQINGGIVGNYSLLLSNNANSGGTCFGDSGGPNFVGSDGSETNVIGGVTSFGLNGNCAGTGGVFRVDRQDVQNFIRNFAGALLP